MRAPEASSGAIYADDVIYAAGSVGRMAMRSPGSMSKRTRAASLCWPALVPDSSLQMDVTYAERSPMVGAPEAARAGVIYAQ